MKSNWLCLTTGSELYTIDLERLMLLTADDHYTYVDYSNGTHFLVPLGLSKVEEKLNSVQPARRDRFQRLGRKHIVNLDYICYINSTKQTILLAGDENCKKELTAPKDVVRKLIKQF